MLLQAGGFENCHTEKRLTCNTGLILPESDYFRLRLKRFRILAYIRTSSERENKNLVF